MMIVALNNLNHVGIRTRRKNLTTSWLSSVLKKPVVAR
jgi:hypothetical protein